MKLYNQTENLTVMGVLVKTFPNGIKEVFESLMKALGSNRAYYGVSWIDESDKIQYYAAAGEVFKDEAKQYNYELLTIEKGEYHTETIHNWSSKTDSIIDVFRGLTAHSKPDKSHPCIEWYKPNDEMICMFKPQ